MRTGKSIFSFACIVLVLDACALNSQPNHISVAAPHSAPDAEAITPDSKKMELIDAANKGDANSAYRLGTAFEFGEHNERLALYWYMRAAIAGLPKAQYLLGGLYEGNPNAGSRGAARYWMKRAAANGVPNANEWLAEHKLK